MGDLLPGLLRGRQDARGTKQASRRGGWKRQEPFPEQPFSSVCRSCALSLSPRPLSRDAQLELLCKTPRKMLQDGTKRGQNSRAERKPGFGQRRGKRSREGTGRGVCLQPAENVRPNTARVPPKHTPFKERLTGPRCSRAASGTDAGRRQGCGGASLRRTAKLLFPRDIPPHHTEPRAEPPPYPGRSRVSGHRAEGSRLRRPGGRAAAATRGSPGPSSCAAAPGQAGGRGPITVQLPRPGRFPHGRTTLWQHAAVLAAALATHPRLPSGNQCHLPSSWEDGQGPAPSVPGVSCRHAAAGPLAWRVPAAGKADRKPSMEPKSGCWLTPGTTQPGPALPGAHLAGSIAGSHVLVAAGPSRRQLLVRDFERANRFLQRLTHLGESKSRVTVSGTLSRQHRAPTQPGTAGAAGGSRGRGDRKGRNTEDLQDGSGCGDTSRAPAPRPSASANPASRRSRAAGAVLLLWGHRAMASVTSPLITAPEQQSPTGAESGISESRHSTWRERGSPLRQRADKHPARGSVLPVPRTRRWLSSLAATCPRQRTRLSRRRAGAVPGGHTQVPRGRSSYRDLPQQHRYVLCPRHVTPPFHSALLPSCCCCPRTPADGSEANYRGKESAGLGQELQEAI